MQGAIRDSYVMVHVTINSNCYYKPDTINNNADVTINSNVGCNILIQLAINSHTIRHYK